jgi:hypothetical protein
MRVRILLRLLKIKLNIMNCENCNIPTHCSMCSENVLNSDVMIYRAEQSDEQYFEEQIGNASREEIAAFLYNEECGDR